MSIPRRKDLNSEKMSEWFTQITLATCDGKGYTVKTVLHTKTGYLRIFPTANAVNL